MKQKAYIFRGSPLSGKSTLAPLFGSLLPQPVAVIRHDMLRWDIHKIDRHFTKVTTEEHRFAFENLVILFEQYLKNGNYSIVIEGLFTWDDARSDQGDISTLLRIADHYDVRCQSFVLRADQERLNERNKKRQQQVPKEEFKILYKNIYKKIDPSEIIVDTTSKSIPETLSLLKAHIQDQ